MIKFGNIDSAINTVYIANTPAFIARDLKKNSSVYRVAKENSISALICELKNGELEKHIIYIILVALYIKTNGSLPEEIKTYHSNDEWVQSVFEMLFDGNNTNKLSTINNFSKINEIENKKPTSKNNKITISLGF